MTMSQNIKVMIYLNFYAMYEVKNADNATTFKMWSDGKLYFVYAQTTLAV